MAIAACKFIALDKRAEIDGVSIQEHDAARAELEKQVASAEIWLQFGQTGEIRITKTRKK